MRPFRHPAWPHVRAILVALHVLSLVVLSIPDEGAVHNRARWKTANARADLRQWAARFTEWCEAADVRPQQFVTRSDLGCGSTIGPITASRLGVRTIDVGSPMLSMHSAREMCAAADVAPMIAVMRRFFEEDR